MKVIAASIVLAVAVISATFAHAQRVRPVMVGADPELDACPSTGRVTGLDRRGDNFLSIRAGPRAKWRG